MKYNEWRDELKSNLLSVPESERRRVLDYYAEAYADRRDAGFTEREIIDYFGAPYDAAQRILAENNDCYGADCGTGKERRREERERRNYTGNYGEGSLYGNETPAAAAKQRGDYTWVFVLLCIIFAIPIFIVVMNMVGVTVGFCVAPFAVLIAGVASIGTGVGALFTDASYGVMLFGAGLIIFGLSLVIMPLCFKLVKWMWKLFGMFFGWLKSVFSGKKKVN